MAGKKVMVITGTRKGLGRYLARYYVRRDFRVIGCSRKPATFKSKNYTHFRLDVSDEEKVKNMLAETRKTFKRLDVLINNAGVLFANYAVVTPAETVQEVFNTNFLGTFLFSREAVKLMKGAKYGRIISISSIQVPLATVGSSIYSASKAAVEEFSRVFAKEVISFGITVNVLGLSFVRNTGMAEALSKKVISETLEKTITKSPLKFEDVINAIDFLISPKSKDLTGQTIYLGGV